MSSRGTCPAMVERARRHGLGRRRPGRHERRHCAGCVCPRQPCCRARGRRAHHLSQRGRSGCKGLDLVRMTMERDSHDADHATPREETAIARQGNDRVHCEAARFSRYTRSTPCLITLELTGGREARARSARKHLGVRVERPVRRQLHGAKPLMLQMMTIKANCRS